MRALLLIVTVAAMGIMVASRGALPPLPASPFPWSPQKMIYFGWNPLVNLPPFVVLCKHPDSQVPDCFGERLPFN